MNAGPQWSRPAFLLIRGVRPNSPVTTTSVLSSSPRSERSRNSVLIAESYIGSSVFFSTAKLPSCVSQLLWSIVTHRTPASTSRRAIRHDLPERVPAVLVAELVRLRRGCRTPSSPAGEVIRSNALSRNVPTAPACAFAFGFRGLVEAVHRFEQLLAVVEPVGGDRRRRHEVGHAEVRRVRVGVDDERRVVRAEVRRAAARVQLRQRDVRRHRPLRPELLRHHRPDARPLVVRA